MTTSEISAQGRRPAPAVTEADLLAMTNTELDELFRSSPAGAVPEGTQRGTVVALSGTPLAAPIAGLTRGAGAAGPAPLPRAAQLRAGPRRRLLLPARDPRPA